MRKKLKIHLVEDSDDIRERLRTMIESIEEESEIAEAASAEAAISQILADRPDVVLLDLNLQSGSGLDVLKNVKPALPQTVMIVLTNNSSDPYRKKCSRLGAEWFFDKALQFDQVENVVRGLFSKLRTNTEEARKADDFEAEYAGKEKSNLEEEGNG